MKIPPVGAEFLHADRRRIVGHTRLRKLTVPFRRLANASKDRFNE